MKAQTIFREKIYLWKTQDNESRWKIVKMVKNNISRTVNAPLENLWKGRNDLTQRLEKLNHRRKRRSGKSPKRRR